ncbi:MAG: GTP 3',8-cyclase MoaA [Firmicutes bacterium]|nr:GTP 3',8-cyclase MoaA [Bacillota bacterium]
MKDRYGREIDYLRISITDRCNLRCRYCMPNGMENALEHSQVLRYEEFVRLAGIFSELGFKHFRVTGGEPLVRKDAVSFVAALKKLPGAESVAITTNGILLEQLAPALKEAGLDAANISLDTTDPRLSAAICGVPDVVPQTVRGMEAARKLGISVKLNAVLLRDIEDSIPGLLEFAKDGIPVRFIELMPIGFGRKDSGISSAEAIELIRGLYPDIHAVEGKHGSGPARYFESASLAAPVGIIDAVSNRFCETCNRVRLTSTGKLKPCLCYDQGVELAPLLRSGASDEELTEVIRSCIFEKPKQHCFDDISEISENKLMSQIGG